MNKVYEIFYFASLKANLFCSVLLFVPISLLGLNIKCDSGTEKRGIEYIQNQGQWSPQILYKGALGDGSVYLLQDGFIFDFYSLEDLNRIHHSQEANMVHTNSIRHYAWQIKFIGINAVIPESVDELDYYYNYCVGNDIKKWKKHIRPCRVVVYKNLWDGIDLHVRSDEARFKYEFLVHKGANPDQIRWDLLGADRAVISDENILIDICDVQFVEQAPWSYQTENGKITEVNSHFVKEGGVFHYKIGPYDETKILVIDPILTAGTFVGSITSDELWGYCATYGQDGSIYSASKPSTSNLPAQLGSFQTTFGGSTDIAISKFSSDGSQLLWATYLGGSQHETPCKLYVGANDQLFILGRTNSSDYPVLDNSFDQEFSGFSDVIISRLSSDGSELLGSTYFGGQLGDGVSSNLEIGGSSGPSDLGEVVRTDEGDILVAITTAPLNSYTQTYIGFQNLSSQITIFKLTEDLSSLIWCTSVNSTAADNVYDCKVLSNGTIAVCGSSNGSDLPIGNLGAQPELIDQFDGYVFILSSDGTEILEGTWYGDFGDDACYYIDESGLGELWVTGMSSSSVPDVGGAYSNAGGLLFISQFSSDLSNIQISGNLGSGQVESGVIYPNAFMVDKCDRIYISAYMGMNDLGLLSGFDITEGAISSEGGFYLAVFSPNMGSVEYGTYLKGNHVDGGTSRFDEKGIIYQAICSCWPPFSNVSATPWAYSSEQISSCEASVFKIDFESSSVVSSFNYSEVNTCLPFEVLFNNWSDNGSYMWNFGDGNGWQPISDSQINYTFANPGPHLVQLAVYDENSCNLYDTLEVLIQVPDLLSDLELTWQLSPQQLCGENPEVLGTYVSNGADSVFWSVNDEFITSSSLLQYNFPIPGLYEVALIAVDSICNSQISLVDTLYVGNELESAPSVISSIPNCAPALLELESLNNNFDSLLWLVDGIPSGSDVSFFAEFAEGGSYSIQLVTYLDNTCNQADTSEILIDLFPSTDMQIDWQLPVIDTCLNQGALELEYLGTGADYFEWSLPNSISSDTIVTFDWSAPGSFPIILQSTDAVCGITLILDTVLNIYGSSAVHITSESENGCVPHTVELMAEGTFDTVSWNFPDGGTSEILSIDYIFDAPGTYWITIDAFLEGNCGNNASDSLYFEVYLPLENSDFSTEVIPLECDSVTRVLVDFIGSNATSYIWNSGNGQFSDLPTAVFEYGEAGSYTIELQVNNELCDESEILSTQIDIPLRSFEYFDLSFPNIFTPNDDSLNTSWKPMTPNFVQENSFDYWELQVFNRWGESVFSTVDFNSSWSGYLQGNKLPEGVYYFTLEYQRKCIDSFGKSESGYVYLIE